MCAAYTEVATTGRISPAAAALLRRSRPATVTDRITAPTLLVQGEQDTLFPLDQADANARQIAATGTPVRVAWFTGGHDGGGPGPGRARSRSASGSTTTSPGPAPRPATGFTYSVQSRLRRAATADWAHRSRRPTYPGLTGDARPSRRHRRAGRRRPAVVNPAGGNPAAISSLPGLGGALGALAGRLTASRPRAARASPRSSDARR